VTEPTAARPQEAAVVVARQLTLAGQSLAVAESLTGGLLAAALVAVPGVSAVFRGGIVAYATDLKHRLLDVPADLLALRGPVDPDVAAAMAAGVRLRCAAEWGLATTGVAGPTPLDGQPAGTVYVAVAGPGYAQVRRLDLPGDRPTVRSGTVTAALHLLTEALGR